MRHPLRSLLVAALLCAAALGLSRRSDRSPGDLLDPVPEAVLQALLDQQHLAALRAIDQAAAAAPERADFFDYLRGMVLERAGQVERSVQVLQDLEERDPDGRYGRKARALRADVYRRQGQHEAAADLYESLSHRHLSAERKAELARTYLEFADRLSTPPETPEPGEGGVDHQRAAVLYAKVLDMDAPRASKDRALARQSWCLEQLGQWPAVIQVADRYLQMFAPGTRSEGVGRRWFEVRMRRARALLALSSLVPARIALEDLVADLDEAREEDPELLAAQDGGAVQLQDLHGEAMARIAATFAEADPQQGPLAIAALQRFLARHPGHRLAARAAYDVGRIHLGLGRLDDALAAWEAFLQKDGGWPEEAREEAARLAMSARFQRGAILARQGLHTQAIDAFERYVALHPNGPDWARAQQGIVESEYAIGESHRREEAFALARTAWQEFLERHPLDPRAQTTLLHLGELYVAEARTWNEAAETSAQAEAERVALLEAALDQWSNVVTKYPNSNVASQALCRRGEVLEQDLGRLGAAIEAYRACTFGSWAARARAHLAIMTEPSLDVLTERLYGSDETPEVRVTARNLEQVTVQVYPLDLEAYFRKHFTHRRIEDLDLDLISPEREWTVSLQDYQDHRLLEQALEIPMEGAGVVAVAVQAGELRSTTLVIRSDLDLLVKSSRKEVFVFAQDRARGAPAAGVRVLVGLLGLEGGPVVETLTTGRDGVARVQREDLAESADLRVFAVRDGHCAAEGLDLSDLSVQTARAARGYLYTDRPAYQPGQAVALRGILRFVEDGRDTFEPGQVLRLEVADSQGRVFHQVDTTLSAFGTIHEEFPLAPHAPQGAYQVRCLAPSGETFTGSFLVQEYTLPRVELITRPTVPVVYRGEEVQVEVEARWYYGEPVSDAPLRVSLPDGRVHEARTDEAGKATLTFATRDFPSEGPLGWMATLTEEQVSAQGQVHLALYGYQASLDLVRDVILEGDAVPVEVTTTAPDGEPVAREVTLRVLRLEQAKGRTDEVLAQEIPLSTDEEGTARHRVIIPEGGRYLLRVQGTDRFGNPVLASQSLFVSGEDDPLRLRLFADVSRVKVGEEIDLRLHNRAGAGLALVTFESDQVLAYRLIDLAEGEQGLDLTVAPDHFPNFAVAVATMQDHKLHTAALELQVMRELRVQVTPRGDWTPGEEASVDLLVTDPLGRPVEAELSLAVVDAALWDRFPSPLPPVQQYFQWDAARVAGLKTTTTCDFRYQGTTRSVAAEVLADRARQQEAQQVMELDASLESLRALGYLADGQGGGGGEPAQEPANDAGVFFAQGLEDHRARVEKNFQAGRPGAPPTTGGARSPVAAYRYGSVRRGAWDFDGPDPSGGGNADRNQGQGSGSAVTPAPEAAFWTPAVVTDAEGRGTVSFALPDQSTRWRLLARGVTRDSLMGEARADRASRAEFFLELRTPRTLLEGDQPQMAVRLHNLTGQQGTAEVRLTLEVDGRTETRTAPVRLDGALAEHWFEAWPVPAAEGPVTVRAVARATLDGRTLEDEEQRQLSLRPFGLELRDTRSGLITAEESFRLELPRDRRYRLTHAELFLGPGVQRLLIEEALRQRSPFERSRPVSLPGQAEAAGDLLGVCSVAEWLTAAGLQAVPEWQELRARGQGLTARLIAAQREDGGWSWAGTARTSEPNTSALAMLALARAAECGHSLPPVTLERGLNFLRQAFQRATQQADEQKAMLQYALAVHGQADFGAVNRLHREQASLSPAALAYTCLALVEMERKPMAAELAAVLEQRGILPEGGKQCRWPVAGNAAFHRSPLEMTALALLALQSARPDSARIPAGVQYLLAQRPWRSLRDKGMALSALTLYYGRVAPRDDEARVEVLVDGQPVQTLSLSGATPGVVLSLPVPPDRARVDVTLRRTGRGEPHYLATLAGFTADLGEEVPGRTEGTRFRVTRHVQATPPPRHAGREVPVGFGTVRRVSRPWVNQVESLPYGHLTNVTVDVHQDPGEARDARELEYLVVEAPLPAGATVLSGSLRGSHESVQEQADRLVFHVGPRAGTSTFSYTLIGSVPGTYRGLPVVAYSAYDAQRLAFGAPTRLDVLPRGQASRDQYRPTPDELYHLGRRSFDAGESRAARQLLEQLFEDWREDLDEEPFRESVRMLLFLAIEREDAGAMVRYFEILKERNPELTVPFDQMLTLGRAYRSLGEHERASLIYRAVSEETFLKDLKVAGTLEEQQEWVGAAETLEHLIREFPDFPSVVETSLALADKMLLWSRQAEQESFRDAGWNRRDLEFLGVEMLRRFLVLHTDDPLAPEAALNLVSARLDQEDYATAATDAERFEALSSRPRFLDAFRYTRAVARWYLGEDAQAMDILRGIAAARYPDEAGRLRPSDNRDLALYILGQIHHARRDTERAIEYYQRVEEQFSDAREAIRRFRERSIEIPEVTECRPGEAVELELSWRNVEQAELLVYPVDLMTLYLREKNLRGITEVNLAGITPTLREQVTLGGGSALLPHERQVSLDLPGTGAYLVIARGDELHTSGLVLVSGLALEVRQDLVAGRIRVEVLDVAQDRYAGRVHVKVIGSADATFQEGESDPRGLFVADGVRGTATVIVRGEDDQYAFYRGRELPAALEQLEQLGLVEESANEGADQYLGNVFLLNNDAQVQRQLRYKENLKQTRAGVKVQQVK